MNGEPIAVIGVGCRFPGADGPDQYWDLLSNGRDAVTSAPIERGIAEPTPGKPLRGGFLSGIDRFDAAFFGITAAEAARMDPQQRLMLEVTWSALEDAGLDPDGLAGGQTGVFVGLHSHSNDYYWMQSGDINGYTGTGTSHGVLAGRLAYLLDLRGLALVVDTACSSALLAVHLAMRSLRSGECGLAIVGGTNLILTGLLPGVGSQMGLLSGRGGCHPFDAGADGIVSGEGCGVVVLKPLAAAQRDGDRLLGVLRGSAAGQDGRSNGLTAPNPLAQTEVINNALTNSGVLPEQVSYVEAHGTGTLLGDPIELEALADVFPPDSFPTIGSVKANIGHLEGAAGIASLIKLLLMLRHGVIPRQINFHRPNPAVDIPGFPACIPTSTRTWEARGGTRIGGVSSFGWSGTNVHVVVEEPPATPAPTSAHAPELLTLSARSSTALRTLSAAYTDRLASADSVADVCYTANTGRQAMRHRLAAAADPAALAGLLAQFAAGAELPAVHVREVLKRPRVAFLFTGQGASYLGMGRELHRDNELFRETVSRCSRVAARWLPEGAIESIISGTADPALLDDSCYAQLALTTLQIALAAVWRSWGVEPAAVLGQSVGELAASCVAGAIDLDDCLTLVAERGRLIHALPPGGGMTAVHAPPADVASLLGGLAKVSIAVHNSPRATVVTGLQSELGTFEQRLEQRAISYRRLGVNYASHSPLVEPILAEFTVATRRTRHQRPKITMIGGATGAPLGQAELNDDYWPRQLREPVRFADGMVTLLQRGCNVFVEIGPGSTLVGLGQASADDVDAVWVPSLRSAQPDQHLDALGQVFTAGVRVHWPEVYQASTRHRTAVPGYPFEREQHWLPSASPTRPLPDTPPPTGTDIYQLDWRPVARGPVSDTARPCVVFADSATAVARTLVEQLRVRGTTAALVTPGSQVSELTPTTFTAVPGNAADQLAVIDRIAGTRPVDVVHLWPIAPGARNLAEEARRAVSAVLPILHLTRQAPIRLYLVTAGAQPVGEEPVDPAQAVWWGLGRTIALEHPEVAIRLVDLSSLASEAELAALAEEIGSLDEEQQIALRGAERHVPRVVPAAPPNPGSTIPVSPEGSYLITGGNSGIGLETAHWLARSGARHLVLVSRRQPDAATRARLAALTADGVQVTTIAADIADPAALAAVFARFTDPANLPPLHGIVHSAGVVHDGLLVNQDWPAFDEVFRPKVYAALALHEHTRNLALDFFVMYSSAASVLGSLGQGNYAAANAFLDALAHHRVRMGLPATVINWGAWRQLGMAARLKERHWKRHKEAGMRSIDTADGFHGLEQALRSGLPQAAVLAIDWPAYRVTRGAPFSRTLLAELGTLGDAIPAAAPRLAGANADVLARLPRARRRTFLMDRTITLVSQLNSTGRPVDADTGFFDLGMDSMQVTELRNALQRDLGISIPSTLLFEHPTVSTLTESLLGLLPEQRAGTQTQPQRMMPARAARRPSAPPMAVNAPIAVVGIGCRFPRADGPEEFWQLLEGGVDALRELPDDRWDPEQRGASAALRAGFLDGVDQFDAAFFGISPREAARMDPQHRLLLEVSWEAIEHARISATSLADSRTGLFVGIGTHDYETRRISAGLNIDVYRGIGNSSSFAAGRVAHLLGLTGPALVLNTACSSALLAVHLACQSLRLGECDVALAGGVSLMLSPENFQLGGAMNALGPDGRCKTFDASANGYARGEGGGIIVLKRLDDAISDGDEVLGVIRGSATNHDGHSSALTAPNGTAQRRVISAALANAGIDANRVDYVEAHGTGTVLGDPIEVAALTDVLCADRPKDRPLQIGSVKTNIGHLEAAAGIAGLIKVLLSLRHRTLPAHLNFSTLNPRIDLTTRPVRIVTETIPWSTDQGPRTAGVSAFGLSGTNVHVVVEEGRQGGGGGASRPAPSRRPGEKVLVLSARSEPALRALAQRYLDLVTADDTPDLADLAHSAAVGRAHLDHRLAIPATTIPEAAERLRDYLVGDASAAYVGTAISTPQLAFAFGDVGPSFPGFGPLPGDERVMREALEECLSLIPEVLPGSVLPVAHDLDGQARRQPALRAPLLVAVQFAYAKLLLSWGAEPVVVSGEGAGEYTAGCVAGVLPLRTALFLAARHRPTAELVPAAEKTAADEVAAVLAGTRFGEPWCGVVSMRSGNSVESRIGTADYWLAPRTASPSDVPGATVFADIGAIVRFGSAASLSSPSPKQVPQPVELSAFDPNAPGDQSRIIAGQLYVLGTDLDLARIQPGSATGRIELPRYPFQRQRHWEKFRATSSA